MSNTQVAANSPWGFACIKARTFMESLETSGLDIRNPNFSTMYKIDLSVTNPIGFIGESFGNAPWVGGTTGY